MIIMSFCLSYQLKVKMIFQEFLIWEFLGQNMGLMWVKNDKKCYFIPATSLPTQFSWFKKTPSENHAMIYEEPNFSENQKYLLRIQ